VAVHPLVVERDDRAEGSALEARRILDIVDRERAVDAGRHIAVLVRARTHLGPLVAEIRSCRPELRFRAVEIEGLAQRQCVQDLLALTRALLHRADRVNWLAILRAPWCGLRLADMHALAADDFDATVWSLMNDAVRMERLSSDGRMRLMHVRDVLDVAFAERGRARLARWIEGAWLALGGADCLRDAGEAADARAYLELVERLDAAGRFDLDRIEDEMAALYAAPDAEADGRLEFMTVHKSKGLEFDTVILPGLHRRTPGDDEPLMRWEEVALEDMDECLIAAPVGKRGRRPRGTPTPFEYIGLLERERSANEAARLLYVGVTRAVRKLHLVGVAQRKVDGGASAPAGSFLGLLWDAVGPLFAAAENATCPRTEEGADTFVPKLIRAVAPAVPEALRVQARTASEAPAAFDDDDERLSGTLDAAVGTLVHAYLEGIADTGPEAWPAERLREAAPAMRVWLSRRGYAGAQCAEGAVRAQAMLEITLASDSGRWVLARRADAAAELALVSCAQEGTKTQVIDRSFVDNGERWIVDYKTANVADEAALAAHAENYRPQLERYARLYVGEGLPLRLAIFYVASGRLVELRYPV
jgi:ATP-dependent exoDNAse (exonuclease V) beta subunit